MTTTDFATRRAEWKAKYLKPRAERPASSARGLHHLALICSDVERTIQFYQQLLGFPLVELMENRDYKGSTHLFFDMGHDNLLAFFDFPDLGLQPGVEALGGVQHIAISTDSDNFERVKARLEADGVPTRVVSVPCFEWFAEQDQGYKDEVLPPSVRARVSVEAGVPMGWREFVGDAGRIVGLTHYGASAAYTVLYENFGLTHEAVVAAARESIQAARSGDAVPAGPVAATGGLPHPTGDR